MSAIEQHEHGCATREALLEAAERLFSQRGYAAVGIREIATAAGANIAAISYHFGGKSDLYLETVRRVMARREAQSVWETLRDPPAEPAAAASLLVVFVRRFMHHLFDDGSDACGGLMLREATEPTDAIDAVVRDYIQPHRDMLMRVMEAINPGLRDEAAACAMHAQSVLGQILHYRVFRPFLERLPDSLLKCDDRLEEIAAHIAGVSLRGLRCDEEFIRRALTDRESPVESNLGARK